MNEDNELNRSDLLRHALQGRVIGSLPSNFTHRTMARVRQEEALRRRRAALWEWLTPVLVSLALLIIGLVVLFFGFDSKLSDFVIPTSGFEHLFSGFVIPTPAFDGNTGLYVFIGIAALLLLCIDDLIRKHRKKYIH
jgi:membrane-bound ClpP family serine protease